jgi:3',5'-cyclic AMP phosphodiesterase CpdA
MIILSLLAFFQALEAQKREQGHKHIDYPDVKFIVFSDPHYYDPGLGTEGYAFEEYLKKDRKLLRESSEILRESLNLIQNESADFVIIPGDLTKDGTRLSHTEFGKFLADIEKTGKEVFVVPGNHDISNPESYGYEDSLEVKHENVSPSGFSDIYSEFGYDEAIYKDPHSLTYIVEPLEGLWLFAMDACRYEENQEGHHPVTGGRFNEESLRWIENMLGLAQKTNKSVIGFMHHGVLEHYKKKSKFFGEYVVEDFRNVSSMFAAHGMRMVFTGHYHAQDIAMKSFSEDNFIFDIQTGSLVTYPCPVRTVEIKKNTAIIQSKYIRSIPSNRENFDSFAKDYVWSGIEGIAKSALIDFKLDEDEAALLSGQVADAFVAHYQGDEVSPEKPFDLEGVSLKGRFLIGFRKKLVWNLWNDLHPADNHLRIDLESGQADPIVRPEKKIADKD